MDLNITLPASVLFTVGPVAVTNGMLAAFVISGALAALALWARPRMGVVPSKFQAALEIPFEFVRDQLAGAFGSRERGDKFLPMVMTLFLFITFANQFALVPLVYEITVGEKDLFRLPTSDLSQTFALALMVMILAHVLALRIAPLKHIGNFIRIKPLLSVRSLKQLPNALLELFLGFMDIIGELAKTVALACRLFGNVFAGEVMVAVIASLSVYTMFIVPIPFYILSIFSGFVQALVFVLLTVQFVAMTVKSVEDPKDAEAKAAA